MNSQTTKYCKILKYILLRKRSQSEKATYPESNKVTFWKRQTVEAVESLVVSRNLGAGREGWIDKA
jgi:hypothetical protein